MSQVEHQINVNATSPGAVDVERGDGIDVFFAEYENKVIAQEHGEVGGAVPNGRDRYGDILGLH